MDSTTAAQTGITIWNALLIAGIPGIIIAILGAVLNHRNSIKLLDKKLMTDLDLKKEEHLFGQKMQVWQLKFDLYKRLLNSFQESVKGSENSTIQYDLEFLARETYLIDIESIFMFKNKDIHKPLGKLKSLIDEALDGNPDENFPAVLGTPFGDSLVLMQKELGIESM